ncbi:MAG: hypothetical protein JEZ09_19705 [Salinivirgaceae bacterium]|nr:hypothetical protein [Salinivirgaceae bacterium]
MNIEEVDISAFSPHLFWDVDKITLNLHKNQRWLIARVLKYGLFEDWLLLKQIYGIEYIAQTASKIRDLSKKSASFLSAISGLSKEIFLCYSTKQYQANFWNS